MIEIIGAACLFLLGVIVTRWIFGIDTMQEYMRVQIRLLSRIAEASGVAREDILEALNDGKLPKEKKKVNI